MVRRQSSLVSNHVSMLDLLSSALAAVIILFVMSPQQEGGAEEFDPASDFGPKSGQRFVLRNVHFHGGTDKMHPTSLDYLENEVVEYFINNRELRFTIEGHANGLNSSSPRGFLKELSLDRARAVYEVLREGGVESKRMSYEGRGDSAMIVTKRNFDPEKNSYEQTALNRRVEILIR